MVAWVGVALAHILGKGAALVTDSPNLNAAGLAAWFCGVLPGFALMQAGGVLQSFSAPLTFLVSAGVYAATARFARSAQPGLAQGKV
ncbi:hypothetical protein D9M68_853930 [compost metagenome]